MVDPAAETPRPDPHARFPWAPALLCAASLAMAAWTWMRYSYAWTATPESLLARIPPALELRSTDPISGTWNLYSGYPDAHRLVRLEGTVLLVEPDNSLFPGGKELAVAGERGRIVWLNLAKGAPIAVGVQLSTVARVGRLASGRLAMFPLGEGEYLFREATATMYLDATASRFHPASVAGLVVGAFGTFVFGLYLRQWLKERGGGAAAVG